jgi:hypothetical protein
MITPCNAGQGKAFIQRPSKTDRVAVGLIKVMAKNILFGAGLVLRGAKIKVTANIVKSSAPAVLNNKPSLSLEGIKKSLIYSRA